MKVFINFQGVIDHLDILDEETARSAMLMEYIESIYQQVPKDKHELLRHIKSIIDSVDAIQRNIKGRKILLCDVVHELKKVKQSNQNNITEIEYFVKKLKDGE